MKSRAEIYGNEAATLLRTVTMYPGLSQQQLLCFHPGKSETAKALLSHLERQGRIFQSDNGGYFPASAGADSRYERNGAVRPLQLFLGPAIHVPGFISRVVGTGGV